MSEDASYMRQSIIPVRLRSVDPAVAIAEIELIRDDGVSEIRIA